MKIFLLLLFFSSVTMAATNPPIKPRKDNVSAHAAQRAANKTKRTALLQTSKARMAKLKIGSAKK
jgi:hypothetical protein